MTFDFSKNYIDGAWVAPNGSAMLDVENPATQQPFARVPDSNVDDVNDAVISASVAQPLWAATGPDERIRLMREMLRHLEGMREEIIRLEIMELGQPESYTAGAHCDYQFERIRSYITVAETFPWTEMMMHSTVTREPVGVVACITPWNYPLGQIVQKVIPAILAGNTCVMKPSQHTPLTAFLLMQAFHDAGFPKGVLNLVSGRGSALGDALVEHPLVDMVSFTGSTSVGISLAQKAMNTMKRVSLELGGKSPCIWLKSDNYAEHVDRLFNSIFLNAGQTCTALSRLLVPREDLPIVEAILLERVADYKAGNPLMPGVKVGPLSSKRQKETVTRYIRQGLADGARLIAGGLPFESDPSYVIQPTIFMDVTGDMSIAREEIFGPVLCVMGYDTVDEAVAMANDTPYGLNAMVCGPRTEAIEVARRIKAGNVYVNDGPRDIFAPFGGYKESGMGREGGRYGMMEFTQLKAVFDHSTF